MSEGIIVAVIAAAGSVIGSWLVSVRTRRDADIHDAQREQKQSDRLEAIERKLDIHNGYAEKLSAISESMIAMQKDIEFLKEGKK